MSSIFTPDSCWRCSVSPTKNQRFKTTSTTTPARPPLHLASVGSGGRGGGGREGGGEDYLWGKPLDLKGREPRFHWLQDVSQEVDGARHACRQEVTR
ncbi:hypothetical protein EYF80_058967 [Liparis tanakae]|uniref:Uncharacterized protein n=1 Tax=Liparis tanakae TaxID=230148 RepID=A0A4Z2ERG1_9TELE|nr:hypothetical protein EYF80_058967 [Liparis tanakae]